MRRDQQTHCERARCGVAPLATVSSLLLACLLLGGCTAETNPPVPPREASHEQAVSLKIEPIDAKTSERLQAIEVDKTGRVLLGGLGGTWAIGRLGEDVWRAGANENAELQFRDVAQQGDALTLLAAGEGEASGIFRSVDAGATWQTVARGAHPSTFWDCFDFWEDGRGVLFGDSIDGQFDIRTTRDGSSWPPVASGQGLVPEATQGEGGFAASGTCVETYQGGYAWIATGAGAVARILRSDDYGQTWRSSDTPLAMPTGVSGLMSVVARSGVLGDDHLELFAAGGDLENEEDMGERVFVSTDLGESWRPTSPPTFPGAVFGLAVLDGSPLVLAVGPGGADASLDAGSSWHAVTREAIWSAALAPDESSSSDDLAMLAILVGPEGRVLRASGTFTPPPP